MLAMQSMGSFNETMVGHHQSMFESTGTFEGHVAITVIFLPLGLWWLWNRINVYVDCTIKGKQFEAQLWYSSSSSPRHPVESLIKVILLATKVVLDFIDGIVFSRLMAFATHSSMEVPFLLASAMEVIAFYGVPLQASLVYWAWIQAYIFQLGLAVVHSRHTAPFEKLIHTVGTIPIIICIVGLVAEASNRRSLPVALIYPVGIILQSLWFMVIAFALYSPISYLGPWEASHDLHLGRMIILMEYLTLGVFLIILVCYIHAVRSHKREKNNQCC